MEFDAIFLWNIIITLIIMPFAWAFNKMFAEIKRLQILLNKTREEYATREELRDASGRVMEALHRLEDKLDKVLNVR
jgi:membrane protein insertase Oxa1/YidC/SpoIIIJ|tara:strand:+ start:1119 stop:1349 length:231 start_codon:yes stop_codon:yes gene_type:complete